MHSTVRTIFILCFLAAVSFADPAVTTGDFIPKHHPTLEIPRVNGKMTIDGMLDEPAWRQAAVADGFAEHTPGNQTKPPVDSKTLVCYDEQNLYLAFIAYDNPKLIRYSLRERDNIFRDDYFGLLLDTYGDASWGYELFVNPLGLQGDLRTLNTGDEDESFDIVWYSRGIVTDSGYQVEVAIPFSSLRFPDKPDQVWHATFWRDRQRETRQRFTWAAIDKNDPCFMCQWGTLTGIHGIKPGSKLDLLPNIVASDQGERTNLSDPHSAFHYEKGDVELSLNGKYSFSSNTAAELTLNPDFSQVESDATQIDVNSPYTLYYSERRPFFQEGADLFSTRINAVYTRSIAQPQVAAKLTGRFGRTSIAYLAARDDKSPLMIPFGEGSYLFPGPKSVSNIVRVKQTILNGSYIGGIFTDRRLEGSDGAGTLIGGDLSLRFLHNLRYDLQVLASRTAEPRDTSLSPGVVRTIENGRHTLAFDGETFWGHGISTQLSREAECWSSSISYDENSPTFRADNGFVTKNDYRQVDASTNLTFRPNKRYLVSWGPYLEAGRVWNFDGQRKDEWLVPNASLTTIWQTTIYAQYLWSRELFREQVFPGIRRASAGINSRPSEIIGLDLEATYGRFIARGSQLPEPVLGRGNTWSASLSVKATRRLAIEPSFDFSQLYYPDGGPRIFRATVVHSRFSYQFSRELFLRLVIDYYDQKNYNGDTPMTYSHDRGFTVEPLLSYKVNAFTVFYIGSGHDYGYYDSLAEYHRTAQRFFVKFQYLFRV
jgi:hypothetical protein